MRQPLERARRTSSVVSFAVSYSVHSSPNEAKHKQRANRDG